MKTRSPILVIDDEIHIRRLLCAALTRAGYEPLEASTAREAIHLAETRQPVAALIDLGLPDRDGLELVAAFAKRKEMALLVVSARDDAQDKIAALDLGADDFVSKPFDPDELLARLRASLRRIGADSSSEGPFNVGEIILDETAHKVLRSGVQVHLTPKEFAMFALLARHAGKVVTHSQILRTVWGPAHVEDIEYLRVTARALRLKLENDPSRPRLIRNEPGIGYRLCE